MTEHLLDFAEEESRLRRLRMIRRIQRTLLAVVLLITLTNVIFVIVTIPGDTRISSPEFFAGWNVPFLFSSLLVVALPLVCLLVALIFGLVPIAGVKYARRVVVVFLLVCAIAEGIGLLQLLMDHFRTGA